MKAIYKFVMGFAMTFMLVNCNSFLTVKPGADQLTLQQVFGTEKDVDMAIQGVYYKLSTVTYLTVENTINLGLYAGELTVGNTLAATYQELDASYLSPSNTYIRAVWANIYNVIYTVNANIEGVSAAGFLNAEKKEKYMGELYAIRAHCYWELWRRFGGVPLIVGTEYTVNATLPRSDSEQVYEFILTDLLNSRSLLENKDNVEGKYRINTHIVDALLARIYLQNNSWKEAGQYADAVISSDLNGPLPDLSQTFLSTSSETIWHCDPSDKDYKVNEEANKFIPASATAMPAYVLHSSLINSFEEGDKRLESWTGFQIIQGEHYYYPAKYKNRNGAGEWEFAIMLRLAEQYLIRAESRARLNDLNGAIADLDVVRQRAGLPTYKSLYTDAGSQQILLGIEHEWQVEYFAELGNRWTALQRFNTVDEVLSQLKPATWNIKGMLWPIPQDDLDRNPFLTPNPSNN